MEDLDIRAARLVRDLPVAIDVHGPDIVEEAIPSWSIHNDEQAVAARRDGINRIADDLTRVCCELEVVELGLRRAESTSELAAGQRRLIRTTLAMLEHVVLATMDKMTRPTTG